MKRPLRRLLSALELFRVAGGRDHPIQLLVTYLYVADHDGCQQGALKKATGMSEASVSRCLDWLSTTHRSGKPGLDLIKREVDPDYWKRYRLFLTDKGRRVADLMADAINTHQDGGDDHDDNNSD